MDTGLHGHSHRMSRSVEMQPIMEQPVSVTRTYSEGLGYVHSFPCVQSCPKGSYLVGYSRLYFVFLSCLLCHAYLPLEGGSQIAGPENIERFECRATWERPLCHGVE